jgi:hypothetical protein
LYGDGTVIRQATPAGGATQEPPITPLETLRLDEAAIQNLLGQAKSAGLLGAGTIDYGDMGAVGVSDMPTTSVTLTAAGSTASHDAYALSAPADASSGRMTPAQVAARAALRGFVALVEQPGPHAKPYAPTRLAVFIAPAAAPPAAGSAPVAWPLAAVPALAKADANGNGYSCSVVEGADVAPLVDAVTKAPIGAQWIAAADRNAPFQVVVRPLLPDEAGCPAA